MKKYILIIIFLIGTLLSFISGYYNDISDQQTFLIDDAIKNNNYEFFLKFNDYYDNNADVSNSNVVINKIYSTELAYNIIIKDYDESDFINSTSDELIVSLSSNEKEITFEYSLESFLESNFIIYQFSKEELIESCGEIITKIEIKNDTYIYSYDIEINTSELTLEDIKNQQTGYTEEEVIELTTLTNFDNTIKTFGLFLLLYIVGVLLYFGGFWIYRNKL